ncbi:MAG TPA: hypothetical protein VFT05_19935, partial [Burkholderiaceae bacterium]|nr:hypothetical protein [Burkholderiaceae bacterium]
MQQSQLNPVRNPVCKPVRPVPAVGGRRWRLIAGAVAATACAGLVVASLWWRTPAVPVPAG